MILSDIDHVWDGSQKAFGVCRSACCLDASQHIYIYNSKFSPRLESATNTASVFADASFFGRVSTKTVGGLMQELDRGKGCRVGMRWDL